MAKHFRDLSCWQLANDLKIAVYELTATPGAASDRDFCHDLRRAARSAPANIAEGFGRFTHRDFAHYLSIARASLIEVENHLVHAADIKASTPAELDRLSQLAQHAQRSVTALRRYLLHTPDRRPSRS